MTTQSPYSKSLFPVGLLLSAVTEELETDARHGADETHAREAGYTRGPCGEWMTAPAER